MRPTLSVSPPATWTAGAAAKVEAEANPAAEVFKFFGFTADNVANTVKRVLA